jgi:hypothetical protein
MRRQKAGKSDKKMFSRTAKKVNSKNYSMSNRGGIRL